MTFPGGTQASRVSRTDNEHLARTDATGQITFMATAGLSGHVEVRANGVSLLEPVADTASIDVVRASPAMWPCEGRAAST